VADRYAPIVSLFSIPRPFVGHTGVIQRNAVRSWATLIPTAEIILYGDDPSILAAAAECGARSRRVPSVNSYGTPLIHRIFEDAAAVATADLVCYVNADILLSSDLIDAAKAIPFDRFLMAGRRWDIDVASDLEIRSASDIADIRNRALSDGYAHGPGGIDYFCYPKAVDLKLRPFAVGRVAWDNWILFRARQLGLPLVDVSRSVVAVHQNHDYSHIAHRTDDHWASPEVEANLALIDNWRQLFTLDDATHELANGAISRRPRRTLWQVVRSRLVLSLFAQWVFRAKKRLSRGRRSRWRGEAAAAVEARSGQP
jgi:hypothetical protein